MLTLWRVVTNRDCLLTCLTQSCSNLVVYGYAMFVPKYLEVQFYFEPRIADLLTGKLKSTQVSYKK